MPEVDPFAARYLGSEYLQKNPTWDVEDSPWKAGKVREILEANAVHPGSIVDVGCGAGLVLVELKRAYPAARLAGYDIAPDAERFWASPRAQGIELTLGDFASVSHGRYDVLLALDVLEHLQDPFAFLARLKGRAAHYVFHFPLDLSAVSVLRETPLLRRARQSGACALLHARPGADAAARLRLPRDRGAVYRRGIQRAPTRLEGAAGASAQASGVCPESRLGRALARR